MAGARSDGPRRRAEVSVARRWAQWGAGALVVLLLASTTYLLGSRLVDFRAAGGLRAEQSLSVAPAALDAAALAAEAEREAEVLRAERREALRAARAAKRLAKKRAERRASRQEARRLEKLKSTPYTFVVGSFNVLGSQHTTPKGQKKNYPPASVRTPRAAALARGHGVDILGTQELQEDQLPVLTTQTGMDAWPGWDWGQAETDNSILYDPDVFEFVSGEKFYITFMGRSRPQPIVRLRHRETTRELYVVNAHPSAGGGKYAAERARGHATIAAQVNRLHATGLPVLLTGDMNDRERFYCAVVATTPLSAANGGGAGCAPPPSPIPVDWVTGSQVSWSGYRRDTTPVDQKTSDHFFISATATVH